MCTAATYKTKDFYFGRTLDYEFSYGDQIVITPRNYSFHFRHVGDIKNHYAIIGMAHVAEDYPLYYDEMNEKGVAMAGLNFVGNAVYSEVQPDVENMKSHCIHLVVMLLKVSIIIILMKIIRSVRYMHAEDLESNKLICYPVIQGERINYQNK